MLSEVINTINVALAASFGGYPGVKVFGLTQSLLRGKDQLPAAVDLSGEAVYVGIDDVAPLIIYHKTLSASQNSAKAAYGDVQSYLVNQFNNAAIVYWDRKRVRLLPDEVWQYVQCALPNAIQLPQYRLIRIIFQSVILNAQQIYSTEYKVLKPLDPGKSLIQVNYQIEGTFDRRCFQHCPEDHCSN